MPSRLPPAEPLPAAHSAASNKVIADPAVLQNLTEGGDSFQEVMRKLGGGNALKQLRSMENKAFFGERMRVDKTRNAQQLEDEANYRRDVMELRARLRSNKFMLLDPKGSFIQCWDMTTTMALVYTLFVTPYEIGMDLETKLDALMICNQLIAAIFLIDIFVQFFLPVPSPGTVSGAYERSRWKLARWYLTSWFLLDVSTIIPFDILTWQNVIGGPVKIVKLLRVLRLLKMAKVLRASAIIQRWESSFAVSSTKQQLMFWSFLAIVLLHWFACGWGLIPALQGSQRAGVEAALEANVAKRMDYDASCTACISADVEHDPSVAAICGSPCLTACERAALAELTNRLPDFVFNAEPWTCRAVATGLLSPDYRSEPASIYAASILVAMLQLVGGVSTILPTNVIEYTFFFVAVFIGTVLFAAVQGIICGVVTQGDPDEILWRQNNDALNYMMADTKLPKPVRMEVRRFFRNAKKMLKRRSYDTLIAGCLSKEMQGDVRFLISMPLLRGVWWLRACEEGAGEEGRQFLEDLSTKLTREAFAPKEKIEAHDTFFIVTSGMANRGGNFLGRGGCWGDIIITSVNLRDTTPATAMGYCEVVQLTRRDLMNTLDEGEYPMSAQIIKESGLKLAVQRVMLIVAIYARIETLTKATDPTRSPTGALLLKAAAGQEPVAETDIVLPELEARPDEILERVMTVGMGNEEWNEPQTLPDGTIKIVKKGEMSEETRKKMEAANFLAGLIAAPFNEQTIILGKRVVDTEMKHDRALAKLETSMESIARTLNRLEMAISKSPDAAFTA